MLETNNKFLRLETLYIKGSVVHLERLYLRTIFCFRKISQLAFHILVYKPNNTNNLVKFALMELSLCTNNMHLALLLDFLGKE